MKPQWEKITEITHRYGYWYLRRTVGGWNAERVGHPRKTFETMFEAMNWIESQPQ